MSSDPPKKRPRLRYSLRAFLIVFTLLSLWLGWRVSVVRRIEGAVQELEDAGCFIAYGPWPRDGDPPLRVRTSIEKFLFGYSRWDLPGGVYVGGILERPLFQNKPEGIDDDFFARLLPAIRRLPSVDRVDLSQTEVTGACCRLLASIPGLRSVDLSRTEVGDSDLEEFALLTNLIDIELAGTNWTDEGLDALRRRLPNPPSDSEVYSGDPFGPSPSF